ncbi:MAG TPA: hypothetical protein VF185_01145 [Patescibacteria group bacterium]
MPFRDVPLVAQIYLLARLSVFDKDPTAENKRSLDETLNIVRDFEEGKGDPEIIRRMDEELAKNMPGYQEQRAKINKEL